MLVFACLRPSLACSLNNRLHALVSGMFSCAACRSRKDGGCCLYYSSVNHSGSERFYACDLTLEETAAEDMTKDGAMWRADTEEC